MGILNINLRLSPTCLVSLDLLTSLDGLLWLQSGKEVGERFRQHQTTVSRNQKKCAQVFGLTLSKQKGCWAISEETKLLRLERVVHQNARLLGKSPLRLEANGWLDRGLWDPTPEGWLSGSKHPLGASRCLELLEKRIVDAWLGPLHEIPCGTTKFRVHPLCTMPMRLLAEPGHPLLRSDPVSLNEAKTYPWETPRGGAYPKTQEQLASAGLWPPRQRAHTQSPKTSLERRDAKKLLHLGSVLSHSPAHPDLIPLPLPITTHTSLTLVVRSDHDDHPALHGLRRSLEQRLRHKQNRYPEIQLQA